MEKFVRTGHEDVKFFVGAEVEKTPAADKRTLFVVGLQDTSTIEKLAKEQNTPHIFLSANRSFDSVEETSPGVYMVGKTRVADWETQIQRLLDSGFTVSIDYPAHKHALVLNAFNTRIWQSRNFIPILSVAIPHVTTSSVNLTIKIDDSNFKETNDGVWCMNFREVTDNNRFTSWNEYSDDLILDADPVVEVKNIIDAKTSTQEATPVTLNDASAGIDAVPVSETLASAMSSPAIETVEDAAAAYTEGTTNDPLSSKTPKKVIKK